MAEVVGNEGMTVLVLSGRESAALADVLTWTSQYSAGPWGDAFDHLHELLDAFGIPGREATSENGEHVFVYETPCETCGVLLDENGYCGTCEPA